MRAHTPRIVCKDGSSMSVQVGEFMYCSPRSDEGPWGLVECGYPEGELPSWWDEFAEDPSRGADTVAGYVPLRLVQDWAVEHGGATNWPAELATEVPA